MKTNHRRGFVAKSHPKPMVSKYNISDNFYSKKVFIKKCAITDKRGSELFISIPQFGCTTHGQKEWRHAVKGAKKYGNSRVRFHENQATRKAMREAALKG